MTRLLILALSLVVSASVFAADAPRKSCKYTILEIQDEIEINEWFLNEAKSEEGREKFKAILGYWQQQLDNFVKGKNE